MGAQVSDIFEALRTTCRRQNGVTGPSARVPTVKSTAHCMHYGTASLRSYTVIHPRCPLKTTLIRDWVNRIGADSRESCLVFYI